MTDSPSPIEPAHNDEELASLMADNDIEGLSQKVDELMRLPQSLCKMRGDCCKVATFKGSLSYEELKALSESDTPDAHNAKEFLTLFQPFDTQDEVSEKVPLFVERVKEAAQAKGEDPERVTFYHCRFLGTEGRCMIHEDRPTGCRVYPFPHENTVYHPGCGFEQKGRENWQKIETIMAYFEDRQRQMHDEMEQLKTAAGEQLDELGEFIFGEDDPTNPSPDDDDPSENSTP